MPDLQELLLLAPPILVALTLHEFSHAYVANRLGDPTARLSGRLTLNPIAHLDPLGTILLFVVNFGWAKPVPVDPRNFANPKRDMLLVALAGPVSNILIALFSGLILRLVDAEVLPLMDGASYGTLMVRYSLFINLVLAFFNLIPIPPLDGSKILAGLLPDSALVHYARFQHLGPFVLLGLIVLGRLSGVSVFWIWIGPLVELFSKAFAGEF